MQSTLIWRIVLLFCLAVPAIFAPATARAQRGPGIDVDHYHIQAILLPDSHEVEATAGITFRAVSATDSVVFELSENLSVQRVLDEQGVELEFGQDEIGPGILSIRFRRALPAGQPVRITVEYRGGFDRDRFSRNYARDESSAYIGPEGSYLLYSSKWFPLNGFLADRATARLEVTVPLGQIVVGPGTQQEVVTAGVTETFGWAAELPTLPNSIVVGRYFAKQVKAGEFAIDCFAREESLDALVEYASAVGGILEYYRSTLGSPAAGKVYRLVEVDDRLAPHSGSLGNIFVTRRELSQPAPPIRQLARRVAYQWWLDSVGAQTSGDMWLVDGFAYLMAALYMGNASGPDALQEELNNLAVLALKFESKAAIRNGLDLGYRTEPYESVVAGKGAWVLNMLRHILGDEKFFQLARQYVAQYAGKGGSTLGFQRLAEAAFGNDLGWFFGEWVDTMGVPELESDFAVFKTRDGFRVSGSVRQDRDLFRMPVEIEVVTKDSTERGKIDLEGKATAFDIETFSMPQKIVLDPDNKILRDSRALQTSVQLTLGNDLKQKGEFVEAIRAYEKALELNPRRSIAHFRLAEVFWEQFNLQAAANSFRDALNGDKDPAWIETWCFIYLGKIYDILGQRQRAMAEYNKALNTQDDTFGAQEEAKKWLATPFVRERTTMGSESRQPG